jgi:aspartate/methionine/tyrosine aminotransferase
MPGSPPRLATTVPTPAPLPPLASRVERIEPFHVMELVKRAAALERAGRSVIHLSIGEPDFTAPPPVVHALQRAVDAGATGYTPALGLDALRRAIARWHGDEFGVDVDPQRVLVTAGASGALLLACAGLVERGDAVLMSDPGYPCNRHFVAAVDGVARPVPVGAAQRFQLDAAAVRAHWTPDVRGVLLASPSNPTGTSIAFDELARVVDAVRERGGFTIVDEIYLGLTYDHAPRSALALGDDVVTVGSFSKFFHMTGWRLGWLVLPPPWVGAFEKLAQNLFICASTLAQQAALACFDDESMAIYRMRRAEFRARRDYIVPALRELGFGVPVAPDGAFYVWLDASAFTADSDRFAIELLEATGVALVPGKDFGAHDPQRWLRLSYATGLDQLHEAVRRLRAWLPARAPSR